MRLVTGLVLVINLTACASYWDSRDPCQTGNKPQGYQMPNFCGAGSGTTYYTRDYYTNRIITTTRTK